MNKFNSKDTIIMEMKRLMEIEHVYVKHLVITRNQLKKLQKELKKTNSIDKIKSEITKLEDRENMYTDDILLINKKLTELDIALNIVCNPKKQASK